MAEQAQATATIETNAERRAGKLTRLAERALAYRAKVAAQAELRLRGFNRELEALGFEAVESEQVDVAGMSDDELETLANGTLSEA